MCGCVGMRVYMHTRACLLMWVRGGYVSYNKCCGTSTGTSDQGHFPLSNSSK